MVQFTENQLVITIDTTFSPIEHWLQTHAELTYLLQSANPDLVTPENCHHVYKLLSSLLPDWETASKMVS